MLFLDNVCYIVLQDINIITSQVNEYVQFCQYLFYFKLYSFYLNKTYITLYVELFGYGYLESYIFVNNSLVYWFLWIYYRF